MIRRTHGWQSSAVIWRSRGHRRSTRPRSADDSGSGQTGCITTAAATAGNRLTATHGIAPNGGGTYVNEYTILADMLSPAASRSAWRCLFQTNTGERERRGLFYQHYR